MTYPSERALSATCADGQQAPDTAPVGTRGPAGRSGLQGAIASPHRGAIMRGVWGVELTDTFGGEANYCWVRRYNVRATTPRGAISKLSRETGYSFQAEGAGRYNSHGACVCAFVLDDTWDINEHNVHTL